MVYDEVIETTTEDDGYYGLRNLLRSTKICLVSKQIESEFIDHAVKTTNRPSTDDEVMRTPYVYCLELEKNGDLVEGNRRISRLRAPKRIVKVVKDCNVDVCKPKSDKNDFISKFDLTMKRLAHALQEATSLQSMHLELWEQWEEGDVLTLMSCKEIVEGALVRLNLLPGLKRITMSGLKLFKWLDDNADDWVLYRSCRYELEGGRWRLAKLGGCEHYNAQLQTGLRSSRRIRRTS
jgi:hypothetical protein